jgi:hypothetical protein
MENLIETLNDLEIEKNYVYLKCIKVGSKLRVRIISTGYLQNANCRFPKSLRQEGAFFRVHVESVKLLGKSKHYYSISSPIKIIGNTLDIKQTYSIRVFTTDDIECVICFNNPKAVIFTPCGHFCLCKDCANKVINNTNSCPMCRSVVSNIITPDQVE